MKMCLFQKAKQFNNYTFFQSQIPCVCFVLLSESEYAIVLAVLCRPSHCTCAYTSLWVVMACNTP